MKGKFSKVLVALIIAMNIAFTVAILAVYAQIGTEPSSLIAAWFSFTTGELWLMASIKKSKVKKEVTKDESNQLETKIDE